LPLLKFQPSYKAYIVLDCYRQRLSNQHNEMAAIEIKNFFPFPEIHTRPWSLCPFILYPTTLFSDSVDYELDGPGFEFRQKWLFSPPKMLR